ncbi:hypothetical protein HDE79_001452 [Rhodanobacter sp. MP1X3]|nr:hypothetical protein [Rhodanobacter sp. MP1X3]
MWTDGLHRTSFNKPLDTLHVCSSEQNVAGFGHSLEA